MYKHLNPQQRYTISVMKQNGFGNTDIADPYNSWQKGSIENMNKLIRQYIPKGSNFDGLDNKTIKQIQMKINKRPREKLDFDPPIKAFLLEMKKIALAVCICVDKFLCSYF